MNQTLFGAAIKNSKTPAQNALNLASFRGLQQALEGDAELAGDPTLTNSLNDNVKSYLLSLRSTQQLPVSDRSFDHMIHFLKSSNQSEATGFFKVLGQKMSPNQFDRLYTRVAKHAQINGDDLSRQMLLKAVSESRQERFQSLSFNQRRKINELSASSKQELSGKISDLVNSREFTDSEKSQICSELLVQNPKQFKRALGHLNKLAKDAPATKISGLKAPVAPEGVAGKSAGQITQQSDVPSLPTRVAGDVPSLPTRVSGDRPSFPTQTTDGVTAPIAPQSETDTVSNSALNILADTLADVMSDSGKKVIFESLKGGRYGNPFSSMGYSSLAIGYEMVSFIANGGYIVKGLSNAASLFDKITGNFISNRASEMASGVSESVSSGVSFIDKQLKVSEYYKDFTNNEYVKKTGDAVKYAGDIAMFLPRSGYNLGHYLADASGASEQLSKIGEKTVQKRSFFWSQLSNIEPSYGSLHCRHFDNNPLKQSLDLVMSHKDVTNKTKSNILSNMNKGLFIKTTCDMSDDRLFELVKSDPKSFDKLLGATLSSRDFLILI